MLPVFSGQASSVIRVSQVANARPTRPPKLAMYHIQVDLSVSKNW